MPKFNRANVTARAGRSPLGVAAEATGVTYEGGTAHSYDTKTELFTLGVANFVGEKTFYEDADTRDARYNRLITEVAVADPAWLTGYLRWLRYEANMRSASLTGAVEAAYALHTAGTPGGRQLVDGVLARADEPGEAYAYALSHYGRHVPMAVKNGIGDGAKRLYTPYATMKYDTASHGVRFADVLNLTHPSPGTPEQNDLFADILSRRFGVGDVAWLTPMLAAQAKLRQEAAQGILEGLYDTETLKAAGATWEQVLSMGGPRLDKCRAWSALIPILPYMALIRNLRNIDEADVSDTVAEVAARRIADPEAVRWSRQLPFRFLSAYREAPSDRWKHPLSKALDACLDNLPIMGGKTLVLVDTSASMGSMSYSERGTVTPLMAAAVLGVALAKKTGGDLYGFADGQFHHKIKNGEGTLAAIERFTRREGEVGHGTDVHSAVRACFSNHDRVFIVSDQQTVTADGAVLSGWHRMRDAWKVPSTTQLYPVDLSGYGKPIFGIGSNIHHLAGLNDKTFKMVPMLERGQDAPWPWEVDTPAGVGDDEADEG